MGHGDSDSREVARAAITLAMTDTREEEAAEKTSLATAEIRAAAVDFGGDFSQSVLKMIERAVVCAEREGLIGQTHHEQGAVAGAAHDAIAEVAPKASGMSVGGKIGIARRGEHIAVAVFFTVGLIHLNEICVGLGHRAI